MFFELFRYPAIGAASCFWVLDYHDDLDADFLAHYGIDLELDDLAGPRFFALSRRITAYGGVMAHRQQEMQEQRGATPSVAAAPSGGADQSATRELPLAAFMMENPGIVAVGKAGG